jgi:hypothetical protein
MIKQDRSDTSVIKALFHLGLESKWMCCYTPWAAITIFLRVGIGGDAKNAWTIQS